MIGKILGSIASRYKEGLARLRRVYGAYKKYGIEKIASFEDLVYTVKRPTEASIKMLEQKYYKKIRAAGEKAYREKEKIKELTERTGYSDPSLMFDNLEATLNGVWTSGKNFRSIDAMERSFNIVWDIIQKSRDKYGDINAALKLIKWAKDFEIALARLIRAIYDKEFKNNLFLSGKGRWKNDTLGASNYMSTIKELANLMGVEPSRVLLDDIGGNVAGVYKQ